MKTKLLLVVSLIISNFAFAEKILGAYCEMGEGCIFYITEADRHILVLAEGDETLYDLPENAIYVIAKINGNQRRYYEVEKSRSELDRFYGGDGYTMIYPFNPYFQPMAGEWILEFGTVQGDICFGQTSNSFKKYFSGKSIEGNIKFPKPFYPEFMMNSKEVKWVNTSLNAYKGYFGNEVMSLVYDVKLLSDVKIQGLFTVTLNVPTKPSCVNKIPFQMKCKVPKPPKDPWTEWLDIPIDLGLGKDKNKPNVPRIEDEPMTDIPRLEYDEKTDVPRLED